MSEAWNDDSPIYKQLEALIVSWILKGKFKEDEALPSVRKLSVEYQINHLTVAKSYQALVNVGVIEKRRGLGMFVKKGAVDALIASEKAKFFEHELPALLQRANELKINKQELFKAIEKVEHEL